MTGFFARLPLRARTYYRSRLAARFGRRPHPWAGERAVVSFTFDDFPRSAYFRGGRILESSGVRGTFYAAFGLMGGPSPSGDIFVREDLPGILAAGHEIGCHTYGHLPAWGTGTRRFEQSVIRNMAAMAETVPGGRLLTHSYPLCEPRPGIKRAAGRHFLGCRGGGQSVNTGVLDLNLLRSCFIDAKNRHDAGLFRELLDETRRLKGWLIFSTHDVGPDPSAFGCGPELLEDIVARAAESGALILPVGEVLSRLTGGSSASGA